MKKDNSIDKFKKEVDWNIERIGKNKKLQTLGRNFAVQAALNKYLYNFTWLGRPILQYPQDMYAMQELIWRIKPDLVIETGIAHGGSLILSASILELINGKGRVLGIDINIRKHNRKEIEKHRMFKRISMIEGSSTDSIVLARVKKTAKGKKRVLVFLDSNHTKDHVFRELELYSPFVTRGSYIVVFDGLVEYMPIGSNKRPWDKGNNPLTAVKTFLKSHKDFKVDKKIESKLLITAATGGYLKRIY